MNSFVVANCTFDGISGAPNPLCTVTGTEQITTFYPM